MKLGMKMKRCKTIAVLLVLLCLLTACSDEPAATATPITAAIPTLAPIATNADAETAPTAAASDTNSSAATYAGLPESLIALLPTADVMHGGNLVVQKGCTACHSLDKDTKVIGPSFYGVGQTAATRVADESAGLYLYNSIVHPNQYVVDTFLASLMPQTYADQLSEEELADIMAYLLAQKAE